jgi:flagellar motor switch protein FliM
MQAEIAIESRLLKHKMKLRDLAALKVGDIMMVDMPEHCTLYAENVPLFRGKLGTSRGNYAVQIAERIKIEQPVVGPNPAKAGAKKSTP